VQPHRFLARALVDSPFVRRPQMAACGRDARPPLRDGGRPVRPPRMGLRRFGAGVAALCGDVLTDCDGPGSRQRWQFRAEQIFWIVPGSFGNCPIPSTLFPFKPILMIR
jgi:hypothetical protein